MQTSGDTPTPGLRTPLPDFQTLPTPEIKHNGKVEHLPKLILVHFYPPGPYLKIGEIKSYLKVESWSSWLEPFAAPPLPTRSYKSKHYREYVRFVGGGTCHKQNKGRTSLFIMIKAFLESKELESCLRSGVFSTHQLIMGNACKKFLSLGPPVALEQDFIHNTMDSGPGIRKNVVMSPTAWPKVKSNSLCTGIIQAHTK